MFQVLLIFLEVANSAQGDLDNVYSDRFPTLNDEPQLPFIGGCVKESMRWMPTDILGVPYVVIRDDEYIDYTFPKSAGIMWSGWAIHQDSDGHNNPCRIDPARYAGDRKTATEGASNGDPSKRESFYFWRGSARELMHNSLNASMYAMVK